MEIRKEIGHGEESVYIYYFPSQKGNMDNQWPCKIGRSKKDPIRRIKQQQASMVEEPIIGLIVWTDNCVRDEGLIHSQLSDRQLESFGKEWYYTSPEYVEESLLRECNDAAVGVLIRIERYNLGWSQKYLARKAGVRQETISLIENCHNTTMNSVSRIAKALGKRIALID